MNLPGENPPPSDNLYVKGLPGMGGVRWTEIAGMMMMMLMMMMMTTTIITISIATNYLFCVILLFHIDPTLILSIAWLVIHQKIMVMIQ